MFVPGLMFVEDCILVIVLAECVTDENPKCSSCQLKQALGILCLKAFTSNLMLKCLISKSTIAKAGRSMLFVKMSALALYLAFLVCSWSNSKYHCISFFGQNYCNK